MRNLKRALSLALAAAMLVSLMVVGASAMSYGDNDSITHAEAVDYLTAVGVVGGDQNGNFQPDATLTRAEYCVMIANMLTGGNFDANLFAGTTTPFTDVAGHWGANYIAYCYSVGVIAGTSATTFEPDATLTAAQAAAILLMALGYNQNNEFGANGQFAVNVTKWAQQAGLYENLSVAANVGITRDNTAQLMFNALTNATPVNYSSLANTYYTVNSSAVSGQVYKVSEDPSHYTYTLGYRDFNAEKDAKVQYGVTGYTWVDRSSQEDITGFYATDRVLYTSTNGDTIAQLTTTSNSKYQASLNPDVATEYVLNGATVSDYATGVAYSDGDEVVYGGVLYTVGANIAANANTQWSDVTASAYAPVKGTVVQLVDQRINNAYDGEVEIITITEMNVAKLASNPRTETSGSVTNVTISSISSLATGKDVTLVEGYEDLAKDDVVLWYDMFNALDSKTYTIIEKAEAVSGVLTAFNDNNSKVTIAGSVYDMSGITGASAYATAKAQAGQDDVTYYLDKGGNVAYVVTGSTAANVNNTLLVLATDSTTSFDETTYQAKALFMDGREETITVTKTAIFGGTLTDITGEDTTMVADGDFAPGVFYTYTRNSNNEYQLTVAENQDQALTDLSKGSSNEALDSGDTSYRIIKSAAKFLMPVTATGATWSGATDGTADAALANASTLFLYYNTNTKTYTVYTGISNVPSYNAGGEIYVLMDENDTYALAVVAKGAATVTAADTYDKIFVTSNATTIYDVDGNYYQYTAIVNGEIGQTVYSYQSLTTGELYYANDYDENGRINAGTAVTTITGANTVKVTDAAAIAAEGGTLTVDSDAGTDGAYVLSDSVRIFVRDTTKSPATVTEITADDIAGLNVTGNNEEVITVSVSDTDASLAYVFITIK